MTEPMEEIRWLRERGVAVSCTQCSVDGFPILFMSAEVAVQVMKGPCKVAAYKDGKRIAQLPVHAICARYGVWLIAQALGWEGPAPDISEESKVFKKRWRLG